MKTKLLIYIAFDFFFVKSIESTKNELLITQLFLVAEVIRNETKESITLIREKKKIK